MSFSAHIVKDMEITKEKWKERYASWPSDSYDIENVPKEVIISSSYAKRFLFPNSKEKAQGIFLEAGCGTARTSLHLSRTENLTVLCADISIQALLEARQFFDKYSPNAKVHFICCDLRNLPFRDKTINYIFSDGAIEHFKDTLRAAEEFNRILGSQGKVLATVPYLSFSMLTYGQLQGNIPNAFILRNLYEWFHMILLKGRLMANGYELSFWQRDIKRIFKSTGFKDISSGHFETFNEIRFVKNRILKSWLRKLSSKQLFWPLIYISATK